MELTGEVDIAAPRLRVWAALNDPAVLARCIDGVESLSLVAADGSERFEGRMNARVGPVRATFTGHVTITEASAPEFYVLVGEGKGGVAGFAKGQARVTLDETAPDATLLGYQVTSSVGGKLAQLGARLIEGTARTYADTFFSRLKAEVEAPATPTQPESVPPLPLEAPEAPHISPVAVPATGLSPYVWGGGLVLVVLLFLLWQWS